MKTLNALQSDRCGAVLPLMMVFIITLMLLITLSINSGWFLYSQVNVQNAADISARASLAHLVGDSELEGRVDRAREVAVELYNLNLDRENADLEPEQVRFGNVVDPAVLVPEFIQSPSEDGLITAVLVDRPIRNSSVEVFLSNLFSGPDTISLTAESVASTRPLDIMLCLDASRSMCLTPRGGAPARHLRRGRHNNFPPHPGSRWDELSQTIELFIETLQDVNPSARVGLATFGGGAITDYNRYVESALDYDPARLENPLTVVASSQAQALNDTMDSYVNDYATLGWGTNIYQGVLTAITGFEEQFSASKHIILLSDGVQSRSGKDGRIPRSIGAARVAANQGIVIHGISFGGNFGEVRDIANLTGGEYFAAASEDDLQEAFSDLLAKFRVVLVE